MAINRKVFFDSVRDDPFGGSLTHGQVEGMTRILDAWEDKYADMDKRWLAYCLATATWETARTMQPIEEYGKGKGRPYGNPDSITGKTYYGRGYVQLTWFYNYEKMGVITDADLTHKPELALDPTIAAVILFEGMRLGSFTGKKLSDYFNPLKTDPVGARRIINGQDKAHEIADIYAELMDALKAATA